MTKKNEMNTEKDGGDRFFVNAYISVIRETMRSLYHLRAEEARMMGSIEEQTNEIQSKFNEVLSTSTTIPSSVVPSMPTVLILSPTRTS